MSQDKSPPRFNARTCFSCGHQWIGANSSCPACSGFGKAGEEMTKKVLDDSDMKKAGR